MEAPEKKIKQLIQDSIEAAKRTDTQTSGNTYIQIIIARDSHIEIPINKISEKTDD